MLENIKALIFVLALSSLAFAFSRAPINALVGKERANEWTIVWVMVTSGVFLTRNPWLFLLVTGIILLMTARWKQDRLALYGLVLSTVPTLTIVVPGFGGIESFAHFAAQDFFALILLLPPLLVYRDTIRNAEHGRWPIVLLAAYFCLVVVLQLRGTNLTNTLRIMFSLGFGMMLPFIAYSKCVDSVEKMRGVVTAMVFSFLPLALIGIFELLKNWHPYSTAMLSWPGGATVAGYLLRGEYLRAVGPTGSPIVLGFLFMVGIGLCLGLPEHHLARKGRAVLLAILTIGLFSPLSRGPWIGTVAILIVFLLTGRNAVKNVFYLVLATSALLGVAAILPGGQAILNMLPFVESGTDAQTVDYRFSLFTNATTVILRNPLFGSIDYLQTPEMQELLQGQGIIDIVNSYLKIALQYGFSGLSLFVVFYFSVLFGLWRAWNTLPDVEIELRTMARALFATLAGALVTIATVSNIGQIPYICLILAGLSVAQTKLIRGKLAALQEETKNVAPSRIPSTTRHVGRRLPGNRSIHSASSPKVRHE